MDARGTSRDRSGSTFSDLLLGAGRLLEALAVARPAGEFGAGVPVATVTVVGTTVAVALLLVENLVVVTGLDNPTVRGGNDRTGAFAARVSSLMTAQQPRIFHSQAVWYSGV
jgi:hypothetical protein